MQNYSSKFKSDLKDRCFRFSLDVIKMIDSLPRKTSTRVIADQLVRSSTSIGANLVEAKASSSRLEYKKFHEISLKSANETKYWLDLLREAGLADSKITSSLHNEATELANMIAAAVIKLKSRL